MAEGVLAGCSLYPGGPGTVTLDDGIAHF